MEAQHRTLEEFIKEFLNQQFSIRLLSIIGLFFLGLFIFAGYSKRLYLVNKSKNDGYTALFIFAPILAVLIPRILFYFINSSFLGYLYSSIFLLVGLIVWMFIINTFDKSDFIGSPTLLSVSNILLILVSDMIVLYTECWCNKIATVVLGLLVIELITICLPLILAGYIVRYKNSYLEFLFNVIAIIIASELSINLPYIVELLVNTTSKLGG